MAVGASKQYHYHAVTQNTTTCKKISQAAEAGPALLQEHVLSLREVNAAAAAEKSVLSLATRIAVIVTTSSVPRSVSSCLI